MNSGSSTASDEGCLRLICSIFSNVQWTQKVGLYFSLSDANTVKLGLYIYISQRTIDNFISVWRFWNRTWNTTIFYKLLDIAHNLVLQISTVIINNDLSNFRLRPCFLPLWFSATSFFSFLNYSKDK